MKKLLILGSGSEEYRRYTLENLRERYDLVLLDQRAPTWQLPYVIDSARFDPHDESATSRSLRDMNDRHHLAGVLTWDEALLEVAAQAAQVLGLPSPAPTIARCRDKHQQRRLFAAEGVPSARSLRVDTVEQAMTAIREIGFPAVVKPRRLGGSIGVRMVHTRTELVDAVRRALGSTSSSMGPAGGALIEEYLDGPEISVDSWVFDGTVEPVILAHKTTGFAPHFEEIKHIVPERVDERLWSAVRSVVIDAHLALGLNQIATHTEIRLTATGPRIVEVNGRLGGELIPHLGHLATGYDLAAAAGDLATGQAPDPVRAATRAAGIVFTYPNYSMTLEEIHLDPRLDELAGIERCRTLAHPGATLHLPPDGFMARLALTTAVASTSTECDRILTFADSLIAASGTAVTSGPA